MCKSPGALAQYKYVRNLTCASPGHLAGTQLYKLTVDMLECPEVTVDTDVLVVLTTFLVLLLVLMVVLLRYKVEIRILLYTRLHVRLPCDSEDVRDIKKYDAFVSYRSVPDPPENCHLNVKKLPKT